METQFGTLLEELGQVLGLKLRPDHLNACRLEYPDGLVLQLETDREGSRLLLLCRIGAPAPGRYRQEFLEAALKANTLDFKIGTFGLSKQSGEVCLYSYLKMENLLARNLSDFMNAITEKARVWVSALASNTVPVVESPNSKKSSGMFGLAP